MLWLLAISIFFEALGCIVVSEDGDHQIGNPISAYCMAKIFSFRFNVPFYRAAVVDFEKYFVLSDVDPDITTISTLGYDRRYFGVDVMGTLDDNMVASLRNQKIMFIGTQVSIFDRIDPAWVVQIKKNLKLKEPLVVNEIPPGHLGVAVHIRKGSGGVVRTDGTLLSEQIFDFDRTLVKHIPFDEWRNYPFEPEGVRRDSSGYLIRENWNSNDRNKKIKLRKKRKKKKRALVSRSGQAGPCVEGSYWHNLDDIWSLKFPPEQYYIDQIKWFAERHSREMLFIQIFTDDVEPFVLVERIKSAVGLGPNVIFYYHDNRDSSFERRIIEDLYNMARFPVLIRSQSYYARVAELMGEHSIVIYPVESEWDQQHKKLIMKTIVVKSEA